jgi:hypothetical protein
VYSNGSVPAVLLPLNHSHDLPPTPSPEQIKQMEEDTNRQFELLKVSASDSGIFAFSWDSWWLLSFHYFNGMRHKGQHFTVAFHFQAQSDAL